MHWAAFCLGMAIGVFAPVMSWSVVTVLVMCGLAFAVYLPRLRVVVWGVLGLIYAFGRLEYALNQQIPLDFSSSPQKAQVQVIDVVQKNAKNMSFVAKIKLDDGRTYRVQTHDFHAQDWQVGQVQMCQVSLRAHVALLNPSGFNLEAWALSQALDGNAYVGKDCQIMPSKTSWWPFPVWREQAWERLQNLNTQHSQGQAMVAALTVGMQNGLNDDTWEAMRRLGVVHLVSISGVHVTMLAVMMAWLMGKILRLFPTSIQTPMLWQCWGGLAVALVYALLAGFQIPTQRTIWMLLVFTVALTFKWRLSLSQVWWVALSIVLLIQPAALLSIGLWLSFGLVAGMIWAANTWHGQKWRAIWRVQAVLLLLTLVLVGHYFHIVPILSPLANAVAIPWFSWVITPLALLAMVLPWDGLLWMVVALAQYTIDVSLWAAKWSPQYAVAAQNQLMLVVALVAAVVCLLPKAVHFRPCATLVMLAWLVYRPPALSSGQLQVQVLDVGQGLAVLLNTQNHVLLFDTGKTAPDAVVLPAIYRQGRQNLDALVLSHNDADHDGGAAEVLAALDVDLVWASHPEVYPLWQSKPCRQKAWQWDGVWFEWLTLPLTDVKNTTNASSCVLRMVTAKQALLIPADIGTAEEALLLAQYGANLHSTVLILGHHGSSSSNSSAWLNMVNPQIAIASSGWKNAYRHPTEAVQNRLSAHEIALYRTDLQGMGNWILDEKLSPQKFSGRLYWWQKKPFVGQTSVF